MADFWEMHPRAAALMRAIRNLGGQAPVDERAEAAKAAAQQVAQPMPDTIMPHEALRRKERERAMMDEMLKGAQ